MELKTIGKEIKPNFYKKVTIETPSEFEGLKGKWRYRIHQEVFDLYDSVADNAKMISLLFSVLTRIWQALPDDIKSNISEEDKTVIDYAINKFKNTTTRADQEFSIQGEEFINKLMERQAKIAEIIQEG